MLLKRNKLKNTSDASKDGVPAAKWSEKFDLIKAYWKSEEKWRARGTLALILGLIALDITAGAFTGVSIQGAINGILLASHTKIIAPVISSLAMAAGSSLVQTLAVKYKDYKTISLIAKWRNWMTNNLQNTWLSNKSHNKLARQNGAEHHPDQRIAQDVSDVADQALSFGVTLLKSAASVGTFAVLLWMASPIFVGAAIGVSVGSSLLTSRIGRSLQKRNSKIAQSEAVLRSALNDINENSDHIAVTGLEGVEKGILQKTEKTLLATKLDQLKKERNLGFFTDFNIKASDIIPIAIAAPLVVAGQASVGSIELSRRYYNQLSTGTNWWLSAYPLWAQFNASADRVVQFSKALAETKEGITAPPIPGAKQAPVRVHECG